MLDSFDCYGVETLTERLQFGKFSGIGIPMLFVAMCLDKPNSATLRLATRADHLEFLRLHAHDIRICGPLLGEDGESMIGSLLILDVADKATAEQILSRDPYRKAGLFQTIEVHAWRWVVGRPAQASAA